MKPVEAVVLDVGGVIFVPDPALVAGPLRDLGIDAGDDMFRRAHYHGIHAIDTTFLAERPSDVQADGRWARVYVEAAASCLGAQGEHRDLVAKVLASGWRGPASEIWRFPVPGSGDAIAELSASGAALAVVSNSDGTVEDKLRSEGVCQVGPGPGVPVAAVVDSTVVGVWKPDPAIFAPAIEALGVKAERAVYVGDSVHYDVEGARAAGLGVLHFDPVRLCSASDHEHVASLGEVLGLLDR